MSLDRDILDSNPAFRIRPVPRCYSQPGVIHAIQQSQIQAEADVIVIALGIVSCFALFLLASGSWNL